MDAGLPPHDRNECDSIRWQTREAIRVFASLRVAPAPGRAELLDPAYLLRPARTAEFRSVLEAAPKSVGPRGRWVPNVDAWIAAEYSAAMAALTTCVAANGQPERHLNDLNRHDWLTVSLLRLLVEEDILPPPAYEDARAVGLAIAIVGYMHGLSHMCRERETIQIAWADGYSRALVALRGLPDGARLANYLLRLLDVYLEARSTEECWKPDCVPENWQEVTGDKHRPLVFPAIVLALLHGLDEVAEEIDRFAHKVGPIRQFLDDYVDVVGDLSQAKVNWCAVELQSHLGEVERDDWPRVLAHPNIAALIKGIVTRDAAANGGDPRWTIKGMKAYATWLCSRIDSACAHWQRAQA
jgi:hypothetical protein